MKKLLVAILVCTIIAGCSVMDQFKSEVKNVKEEYGVVVDITKDILSNFDSETIKSVSNTVQLYVQDGQLTDDEIKKIKLTLEDTIDTETIEKIIKKTKDSLK